MRNPIAQAPDEEHKAFQDSLDRNEITYQRIERGYVLTSLPGNPIIWHGDWLTRQDAVGYQIHTNQNFQKLFAEVDVKLDNPGSTLAELESWNDLLAYMLLLAPATSLEKSIEVTTVPISPGELAKFEPVIAVCCAKDAVDPSEDQETRSSRDNKHHPEQLVLLRDRHPYGKHGDLSYTFEEGGMRGDQSGIFFPDSKTE